MALTLPIFKLIDLLKFLTIAAAAPIE